jgi:hypothetical protein
MTPVHFNNQCSGITAVEGQTDASASKAGSDTVSQRDLRHEKGAEGR